jgi:hypothetical protein
MTSRVRLFTWTLIGAGLTTLFPILSTAARPDGELRIEVVDSVTGKPIAARMHLHLSANRKAGTGTSTKRPVKLNSPVANQYGGHFYIDGRITLPLRVGSYTFELESSPEYLSQSGHFQIDRHADDMRRIEMKRVVDLAKEGWYGADLDVRRNPMELPLILRAEGLTLAPFFDVTNPPAIRKEFIRGGGESQISIAPTPYVWDLPLWLAEEKVDAIQLIHHHSLRSGVIDNESDGRSRDKTFFPGAHGNGQWSETIYYHVLNCGLRIPPAAGSGSGVNDSPIGTNRVYVYCGNEFSDEAWWAGLKAGRVFVTNGPLLRPTVEGQPPGHIFHLTEGQSLKLEIGLNLATAVPVEYLQIIKDGAVDAEVRLADWKNRKGRLPALHFDHSGWFLVRAVTRNPKVYQFASSGPYYVEKSGRPRVSRKSAQFFLEWLDQSELRPTLQQPDSAERDALLAKQKAAREFFLKLQATANAD